MSLRFPSENCLPETFRRSGYRVVDFLTHYLENKDQQSILPPIEKPGEVSAAFPNTPPSTGQEDIEALLQELQSLVLPGLAHHSGGELGYIPLVSSLPASLGHMITGVLNQTRVLWRYAPAATELEAVVLDWLRQMLGLPQPLFGMIHHNSAILQALAAAREMIPGLSIRQKGLAGRTEVPRLRIYASQEAHVSVDKAAIVLGIGEEGLRKIGVDDALRMDVAQLEQALQEDKAAGWLPFAVVATVGTTSTGSIDPVQEIAEICRRSGLWLHVDAAYAGAAAIVPEKRWVLAGCDQADSFVVNPHKWLFTSVGCSVLYTRWPDALKAVFGLPSDYLAFHESADINLGDYSDTLPHGMPALTLWMVLRFFGQQGLAARIREHCRLAQRFVEWLDEQELIERMAPAPLSIVCFRLHPPALHESQLDALNARVVHHINAAGRLFLSTTRVRGKLALRITISNLLTTEQDLSCLQACLLDAIA
jgi:aromatic-L-amino-acid decarboxylase